MGYQFAGFLVAARMSRPESLPQDAVWRDIALPFQGVGVFLPHLIGKEIHRDEVQSLAQKIGVLGEGSWLFLQYDCWGGAIDFVYGMGVAGGHPFGPIENSALDTVESTYIEVMSQLGISAEDSLNFAPFERGFWGEE